MRKFSLKFWTSVMAFLFVFSTAYATTTKDKMVFEGPIEINGGATLAGVALATGASTAFDDIADPDAAGTIAMTTYMQTLTSTATATDSFNFQGLGAFGDTSVMRIEQKTGNPTDGTVLEVVAADANVDPLVVSSSALANAFVVGQNTGTVTAAGPFVTTSTAAIGDGGDTVAINSSDWDISATGAVTGIASITFDNSSGIYISTVTLTAANVKALRATPQTLVAAVAASIIELDSVVLILNYGSEVFTESTDNLVVEYEGGTDCTAAIETTGFIDQNADQVAIVRAATVPTITAAASVNKSIRLFNTGDGEIAGNASNDSVLTVRVSYKLHASGL
jgi:hypothetical protein